MKPMTDSMFELEIILKAHAQRYPLMQPVDAVKLIYQNEFGGGHLIRDVESFLNHLRREYALVEKDPAAVPYEPIGNGIVRVNLAAMDAADLDALGQNFIRCAAEHTGSLERFRKKLSVLQVLTAQGLFAFTPEALEQFLQEYAKAGYPCVSHSEAYRTAYKPAYRILCQ